MTQISAKHALLPEGWAKDVTVEIASDGTISHVKTSSGNRAAKDILLPALPNLHSHAFQRAMAGRTEYRAQSQDSFWSWRELMYRFLDRLTPEHLEAVTAYAFLEMQEAGYASVAEFHYVHHQPGGGAYDTLPEMSARVFAAAGETGIGLTHLPVLYSYGGAGEVTLSDRQQRFGNDLARFTHLVDEAKAACETTLTADCKVGVAPHSMRATTPAQLKEVASVFTNGPIHIHIAEQPREVSEIETWLGARPVEWLLDNIGIGPNWCLVHATHMTEKETRDLAKSGAVAGLCPITEANLGDGPFDGPHYLEESGRFGIGTDSNVRISVSEELRTLEYSQRLRDVARNVLVDGPGSVGNFLYQQSLTGGAAALGRNCGKIAPGFLADLVVLDGQAACFEGTDPTGFLDQWVFAADDGLVRDLWSAGRHCVSEGRHVARERIEANYRAAIKSMLASL